MPDLTETLLADALAEFRATPLPSDVRTADAVRRTVHRRRQLQAAALSVLAVAAVTVPTVILVDRHGHQPTPAATATQAASAVPTQAASPTSLPPSPSPSVSKTGSAAGIDPGAYVPASWLAPNQLPFDSTYSWVSLTPEPTIYSAPASGHETSCSGMWAVIDTSGGSRHWQLWGYGNKTTGTLITYQLAAYQFLYPDGPAAQHAFQQMQNQLSACSTERQVDGQTGKPLVNTVHQTASISNGFAFVHTLRDAAGKPAGTAILMSDSHEYLVQRGSIIALIEVLAADSTIDQWNNDPGVLQQMADHLCLPGRC